MIIPNVNGWQICVVFLINLHHLQCKCTKSLNKSNYTIKMADFSWVSEQRLKYYFKVIADKRERMSSVRVKENEPFDVALRRFKRLIEKTGLLNDLRAREFYEKPTWERKRKAAAAVKRQYRRLRNQTLPAKLY